MPFFDTSTPVCHKSTSPARAYHSYMCSSECEYTNKNTSAENSAHNKLRTWMNPQSSLAQDKRLQLNISRLRDILSDTIAGLTKENNLKKGESVELTLEIELMKSIANSPTNSLVEVTIIQHNNKQEKSDKEPNKMIFKIEQDKLFVKEPLLQKRQSWFKRVISRENDVGKPSRELKNNKDEQREMKISRNPPHKPLFCPIANNTLKERQENPEYKDARNKFINILPEETITNENSSKGRKKVSKREKRKETPDRVCPTSHVPRKVHNKSSVMRKISDIFLPTKKLSKIEAVKKAVATLKNEIHPKTTAEDEKGKEKHDHKRDTTPIQNLGKMTNNTVCDEMAKVDIEDRNKIKKEPQLPKEPYQRYFEPVTKPTKKRKKLKKRRTSPSLNRLYRSHSDTCCMRPLQSKAEARIKSSKSIADCRSQTVMKTPPRVECLGNPKRSREKRKRSHTRDYSKHTKKDLKGEKKVVSNLSPKNSMTNELVKPSRSSLIHWNGRHVKVRKDVKARIEMLIVNELENLALKEGMECDVLPLPPAENTFNDFKTVEKMSSFVCELDISDKNVKKMMKKKSLHRKVSVHHSRREVLKTEMTNVTQKGRTRMTLTSNGTQTAPIMRIPTLPTKNNNFVRVSPIEEVNCCVTSNNEISPFPIRTIEVKEDSVEVKYMNKNVQNWSAESQTITSPEMITSNQHNKTDEFYRGNKNRKSNRFISTGFVKIIQSDDSNWNKHYSQSEMIRCERLTSTQESTDTNFETTEKYSSATQKSSSKTSNELDSSIEIELDIQDLEYILKEAKKNYHADKVLIEAKSLRPTKKHKPLKTVGKNSPSYTNQLLTNAAKKLEQYTNVKKRNKKSKH